MWKLVFSVCVCVFVCVQCVCHVSHCSLFNVGKVHGFHVFSSFLSSSSHSDQPSGRVHSGSAGEDGDLQVHSCGCAHSHYHLETQLGAYPCQWQVGSLLDYPPPPFHYHPQPQAHF